MQDKRSIKAVDAVAQIETANICREILTEKFLTKIKEMRTEFEQVKKRLLFKK